MSEYKLDEKNIYARTVHKWKFRPFFSFSPRIFYPLQMQTKIYSLRNFRVLCTWEQKSDFNFEKLLSLVSDNSLTPTESRKKKLSSRWCWNWHWQFPVKADPLSFSDLHQHPRVATPQEPAALLSRGNEREAEKDKQGEIERKKLHMSKPLFHGADRRG